MNPSERKTFNKEYRTFLWSSILIALSACLGNVVDAVIVGNLIGADGVSAINISRTIIQLMFTLNMLLATGAGMLVGMELGKQEPARASYIFTVSTAACLVTGLLMTACGLFCPDVLTRLLCDNEQLYQPTYDYLRVTLLGAPVYMLMWCSSTMVSVDGSPKLVSLSILVDNAVNLGCDIVFINYLGWGIEGSSAATVTGHIVGIAMMAFHFFSPKNNLRLSWSSHKPALGSIVSQGAPLAIASVCLTVLLYSSNTIVLSSMGRTGIFAFALCMNLLQIYNLFLSGVCRTIQSFGSIQVGKGDNEAFLLVLRKSFSFITIAMFITCAVVWVWPESIVILFGTDETDLISEANYALRIFAVSFVPFCYIYTTMIVYKLYGYGQIALFISFALSLTVVPVLWLMSKFALNFIWYSFLIAYIIEIVAIVILHKTYHATFKLNKENI